jgi:hypothetical protein
MLTKIELTLSDSGQFIVNAGGTIIVTFSLREALMYINYHAKYLAFYPTGNMNCPYANPIPFVDFVKQQKKEAKKKPSTTPTGGEGFKTCT